MALLGWNWIWTWICKWLKILWFVMPIYDILPCLIAIKLLRVLNITWNSLKDFKVVFYLVVVRFITNLKLNWDDNDTDRLMTSYYDTVNCLVNVIGISICYYNKNLIVQIMINMFTIYFLYHFMKVCWTRKVKGWEDVVISLDCPVKSRFICQDLDIVICVLFFIDCSVG